MVIYTKRGDKGKTSLYDEKGAQRERVSKHSLIVEALGALDELNSYIGVAKTSSEDKLLIERLEAVQNNLLRIGSITGGSKLRFSSVQTRKLEEIIDELEGALPVLSSFILPGGSETSAYLQYARSLSRKAERSMVRLDQTKKVKPQILRYLNRLSDYLFMLARNENIKSGFEDDKWKR